MKMEPETTSSYDEGSTENYSLVDLVIEEWGMENVVVIETTSEGEAVYTRE